MSGDEGSTGIADSSSPGETKLLGMTGHEAGETKLLGMTGHEAGETKLLGMTGHEAGGTKPGPGRPA